MGNSSRSIILAFLLFLLGPSLWAQDQGNNGGDYFEGHLFGGALVANIPGVDTTLSMVGLRAVWSNPYGNFEGGFFTGNGKGNVNYNIIDLNYRLDFPLAGMKAFALVGGHGDFYKESEDAGAASKFANGWHIGGGMIFDITQSFGLRGDFEWRFGPGTSLFTGISVIFRFAGGGGGGA